MNVCTRRAADAGRTLADVAPTVALAQLGSVLAFVAGATNVGGLLLVGRYTSHMTGAVADISDNRVSGFLALALSGTVAVGAFVLGAATAVVVVNWARRHRLRSRYGLPLLIEAALLLLFGLLGPRASDSLMLVLPLTALVLCFQMGLQNAVVAKISRSEVRATQPSQYARNGFNLVAQAALVTCFLAGGLIGAFGFNRLGFAMAVPLAVLLVALAARAVVCDVRLHYRWHTAGAPRRPS